MNCFIKSGRSFLVHCDVHQSVTDYQESKNVVLELGTIHQFLIAF